MNAPFTVACVPTGIKAGVLTLPLWVSITPTREWFSVWLTLKLNFFNAIHFYSDLKLIILSGSETDPLGPSPFLILSTNSIPSITLPKTV